MSDLTKISERIQKMIAKAESTDFAEEADMLMSKVSDLLTQHNINLLEVDKLIADKNDPVNVSRDVGYYYQSNTWFGKVAASLAIYYDCAVHVYRIKNKFLISVVGRESARITFSLMLPFVHAQIKKYGKNFSEIHGVSRSVGENRVGTATAIRISKLIKDKEQQEREQPDSKNALVPIDDIKAMFKNTFGFDFVTKEKNVRFNRSASNLADKISLNTQVKSEAGVKRIR